jgi:hypothetical protein
MLPFDAPSNSGFTPQQTGASTSGDKRRWKPEEDAMIYELWNSGMTMKAISDRIAGRSYAACRHRCYGFRQGWLPIKREAGVRTRRR